MEKQPFKLTLDNKEFEINNRNSVLITYAAQLAIHNHLRLYTDECDGYIFQDEDGFAEVATYMVEAEMPLALNIPDVPDHVVELHATRLQGEDDIDEEVEKWRRMFEKGDHE